MDLARRILSDERGERNEILFLDERGVLIITAIDRDGEELWTEEAVDTDLSGPGWEAA